jgi:hypothetical protein
MRPITLRLLALALFTLAAPTARADQISWSYGFAQSTDTVFANASSGDGGRVVMSPLSGSVTSSIPTAATITAVNLQAFSGASAIDPSRFKDAEYTLIMRFTDLSSGLTAAVTFEGILNGTVSASGASLHNTFVGQTQYSFNLNHHIYDISIGDFKAPGGPGSGDLGSITVDVSIHHNPEPSALVLGALGLPGLAWLRRRKRIG